MDTGTPTSPEFYACPNTHTRVPILTILTHPPSSMRVPILTMRVPILTSLCVSTYIVVRQFPNPIAIDPRLRRD